MDSAQNEKVEKALQKGDFKEVKRLMGIPDNRKTRKNNSNSNNNKSNNNNNNNSNNNNYNNSNNNNNNNSNNNTPVNNNTRKEAKDKHVAEYINKNLEKLQTIQELTADLFREYDYPYHTKFKLNGIRKDTINILEKINKLEDRIKANPFYENE